MWRKLIELIKRLLGLINKDPSMWTADATFTSDSTLHLSDGSVPNG